jgi:competence ComEA-like helix-hairpin-helix protein
LTNLNLAVVLLLVLQQINLNTATQAELETLPGVGPVLAGRIIEFREKRDGFKRVEELLAIPGVSERRWQELRPRLVVSERSGTGDAESRTVNEAERRD